MKTHWKKTIDKDWIGTYVLPEGKSIVAKLIGIKYEEVKVKGVAGMYKVAYFEKNEHFDKPMLLSASVNLKRIEKITKSPYIEDWTNLNIYVTLQQEMDKAFGGGRDWALRISETLPTLTKPELLPTNTKVWNAAITHIKKGGDLSKITDNYSISETNLKKINDEAKV